MFPIKPIYFCCKKIWYTSLCCLLFLCGVAQNNTNYIEVTSNGSNFTLSTAASLETQQVLPKAITVMVQSKSFGYNVYVRINNSSYATSTPIPYNKLAIKINSFSSSGSTNINQGTIYLSNTDQWLLSSTKNGAAANYYYDLILDPLYYDIKPGSYSFTLLYTMTQP